MSPDPPDKLIEESRMNLNGLLMAADSGWIDVSLPIKTGMVTWPGDPAVSVERSLDMARGDSANVSAIKMCSHTGTHIDAPVHFLGSGPGVDELPLSTAIGPARVIEIEALDSVRPGELVRHEVQVGERILLKTNNSSRCWQTDSFVEDYVYLSLEAAKYLVDRSVRMVGIDYLSVDGFKNDSSVIHRLLLEAGIWIIEGLNLSQVKQGSYLLVCLPLRIAGGDGAPARVVLKPVNPETKG
jgi:arylformamidase